MPRAAEPMIIANSLAHFVSDNVSAVYEPPEPTARAAKEVPGLSQATFFTGCRASERSERGVTPSVLADATGPWLRCKMYGQAKACRTQPCLIRF